MNLRSTIALALECMIREMADALVAAGRAVVRVEGDDDAERTISLRPHRAVRLCADCRSAIGQELLDGVRDYVSAVLDAQVEIEARRGASGGRITLDLGDGRVERHHYNSLGLPRVRAWDTYRFDAY